MSYNIDPREDKLPRWAQSSMDDLRRRVDDLERSLDERSRRAKDTGIVVWRDRYAEFPIPVTQVDDPIRFAFDGIDGRLWIDVWHKGGSIQVSGSDTLRILPHVSNVISVAV